MEFALYTEALPPLESVILKIKRLSELTPEEEIVYLIHIEKMPEEEALKFVDAWYPMEM